MVCDLTPCSLVKFTDPRISLQTPSYFCYPEDGNSRYLRNKFIFIRQYMALSSLKMDIFYVFCEVGTGCLCIIHMYVRVQGVQQCVFYGLDRLRFASLLAFANISRLVTRISRVRCADNAINRSFLGTN